MKLNKRYLKSNKAITLIALVITVIVLLILAGVTIATLTGDNGLLTKAGEARNVNIDAEIEEEIRLALNKTYIDSYLDITTDKTNALKTELEKNGYTVEDVTVNGTIITITNYRGKNKRIDLSTGIIKEIFPVEYSTLKVGDYVDYPVYYNNIGTWINESNGQVNGNYPKDEYTGWRIINVDSAKKEVKLVSAGVPMSYYHGSNSAISVKNLTTNFFNVSINSTKTEYNFYQCGFKETKESTSTISNIANLKDKFINDFTQNIEEIPKVQVMTIDELDAAKTAINSLDYKSNDLLAIPCKESNSGEYAMTWLASVYNDDDLWYLGYRGTASNIHGITRGIRIVVTLKAGVKFIESQSKTNDTTTYELELD